jgi:hypothetical protein
MKNIKTFDFFTKNMPELYKKYGRTFIALKDENILGAYDTFNLALKNTLKTEKPGSFLIQECFENKEQGVYYFQNNVSFENLANKQ